MHISMLNIYMYICIQGVPKVDTQFLLGRANTSSSSATSAVNTSNLLGGSGGSSSSNSSGGITMTRSNEENKELALIPDPTIYCTRCVGVCICASVSYIYAFAYLCIHSYIYSYKKRRFYCFTNRPPNESTEPRDVINEVLTEEERGMGGSQGRGVHQPTEAILHTNYGICLYVSVYIVIIY